jgi:hypothetical protein
LIFSIFSRFSENKYPFQTFAKLASNRRLKRRRDLAAASKRRQDL